MKKIAITGHSKGLGTEFYKRYLEMGYTVSGFSRSNGYDLRDWSLMQKMITQIQDYDIFINIAKPDFVQTTILYELWKVWRNQHKTIINIGSGVTYSPVCPKNLFDDPDMDFYRTAKISLNEASAQLAYKSTWPKIILVNPSHLYSQPPTLEEQEKLTRWTDTLIKVLTEINDNQFDLKMINF
jgi:hypothetical protein